MGVIQDSRRGGSQPDTAGEFCPHHCLDFVAGSSSSRKQQQEVEAAEEEGVLAAAESSSRKQKQQKEKKCWQHYNFSCAVRHRSGSRTAGAATGRSISAHTVAKTIWSLLLQQGQ